jgi:hypothetical protein
MFLQMAAIGLNDARLKKHRRRLLVIIVAIASFPSVIIADITAGLGLYFPSGSSGTMYFTDGTQSSFFIPNAIACQANIDGTRYVLSGLGLGAGVSLKTTSVLEFPRRHNWPLIPIYGKMTLGFQNDNIDFKGYLNAGSTTHGGFYSTIGAIGKHISFDIDICTWKVHDQKQDRKTWDYSAGYSLSYNIKAAKESYTDGPNSVAVSLFLVSFIAAMTGNILVILL